MSTTTKNFGLTVPELSDAADFTATNPNWETIDQRLAIIDNVYSATSTDGVNYTITDDTLPEPYVGMTIKFIPNIKSTSVRAKLSVNGSSFSAFAYCGDTTTYGYTPRTDNWLIKDYPVVVFYNGSSWFVHNRYITSEATTELSGLMSKSDKTKLNSIETGAQKNFPYIQHVDFTVDDNGDLVPTVDITNYSAGDVLVMAHLVEINDNLATYPEIYFKSDGTGSTYPIYVWIPSEHCYAKMSGIYIQASYGTLSYVVLQLYFDPINNIWICNQPYCAKDYTYGTEDLTAGTSALETGKLYFVYE